jgi:hypothetical protein
MYMFSRRPAIVCGLLLAVGALVALGALTPGVTVGEETDVTPPSAEDPSAQPPASTADDDAAAGAQPPASLPDAGNGGYLGVNSTGVWIMIGLLVVVGTGLASTGVLAARHARNNREE